MRGVEVPGLDNAAGFHGSGHVDTWAEGGNKELIAYEVEDGFWLGLKNPEIFLAHLDIFLAEGLRCVVSIRHPVPVINSWVWHPRGGMISLSPEERKLCLDRPGKTLFGEGKSLPYTSDRPTAAERRIDLYNHLVSRISGVAEHTHLMVVRHEDWFTGGAPLLNKIELFLGMEPSNSVRPAPKPSTLPIRLPRDEIDQILEGCTIAARFGYETNENGLKY